VTNQAVVLIDSVNTKHKAEELIGKVVSWEAPGKNKKVLKGRITAVHGNNGAVRTLFETGIPGQAIGKKVQII